MVIDFHTHLGRGEQLEDTSQVDQTAEALLAGMEVGGVDASCVMGVAAEDFAKNNREIWEVAQAHPGRIIGFARANLHEEPKALAEIRRCLEEYGFRGVKIHVGLGDGFPTRGLMDLLSEHGCPLLLHTPQELKAVEAYAHLARAYPKVPVVMGHMGVFNASWPGFAKLCAVEAKQLPNLYLDTAFVFRPDWIKMAADICGPEKVLFASDAPVVHPAVVRKAVEVAGFSEGELGLILGGNAARLLKWDAS